MAFDAESRKKLQIILVLGILIAGGRAAWIVYERHEAMKEDATPKQEAPMKADNYVTPKKLHPYDLKTARELTEQPEWVKLGGQLTYYPYDRARHKTEWAHEEGTLGPLEKIQITDVVMDTAPKAPGTKQVMAVFEFGDKSRGEGKTYAVPIGAQKEGDLKIYSDDIFFIEDPRGLYNFWPADVWKAIDAHEVQKGMSELQANFAIGMGMPTGSGDYGWRTLQYANDGKPVTVTFENDKAVEIKAGAKKNSARFSVNVRNGAMRSRSTQIGAQLTQTVESGPSGGPDLGRELGAPRGTIFIVHDIAGRGRSKS